MQTFITPLWDTIRGRIYDLLKSAMDKSELDLAYVFEYPPDDVSVIPSKSIYFIISSEETSEEAGSSLVTINFTYCHKGLAMSEAVEEIYTQFDSILDFLLNFSSLPTLDPAELTKSIGVHNSGIMAGWTGFKREILYNPVAEKNDPYRYAGLITVNYLMGVK